MDVVAHWHNLYNKLVELRCHAQNMAEGSSLNGEFYWLGRQDALKEAIIELEPLALSVEEPTAPSSNKPAPTKVCSTATKHK